MSQENVEVVRRAIESYESDEEAWLGTLDPEIVWYPVEESHSPSRGRDSARRTRERWLETFDRESYRHEIEELRGKGEDIVAVVCVRALGKGSGIELEDRTYAHWQVHEGRIVYVYEYATREEALEAAGISE